MKLIKVVSVACLLGISLLRPVDAFSQQLPPRQSVTLAWSPSPDGSATGYNLYYGRMFVAPTNRLDVGTGLTATVTNLEPGLTYFFYATAYDASGVESEPSNLITHTPALAAVSLSMNKTVVSETDSVGAVVTVGRSGSTVSPLTVLLDLGGSARSGADFAPVAAFVVIPAGAASVTFGLKPIHNLIVSPDKTVTLSLVPDVNYQFGTPDSITLRITNQDVDADQDGMSNAAEQLAGTGVNDSNSNLRIHSMSRGPNGQMTVRWGSVPGIRYRLLFASSLDNADWTPVSPPITAAGSTASWTFTPTNTAGIYGLGF